MLKSVRHTTTVLLEARRQNYGILGTQLVYILFSSDRISPRGMDGVADGDNVSRSGNIQVRPREGDEARVSHSVLVPT